MLQGGHERLTQRQTDRRTDRQTGWIQYTPTNFVAVGIMEPPTMLLVPICRDMQLWWDKPPIPSPRKRMPSETCFDDVGRICACVTWTQMYVTLQTKNVFHSKAVIILFLISLFVSFFCYSFQYRRSSIRPSTQFIHFCRRSAVETIIC